MTTVGAGVGFGVRAQRPPGEPMLMCMTTPHRPARPARPCWPYWHVWRDEQGISHQRRATVEGPFTHATVSAGSAQVWQHDAGPSSRVIFLEVVPGEDSDWHENPAPQWIIPISGRWFVETMDGVRVEMGPGELSFGEDQGCRWVEGKRGHLSGAVGSEPAVLMLIQMTRSPAR